MEEEAIKEMRHLSNKFHITLKVYNTMKEGTESIGLGVGALLLGVYLCATAIVFFPFAFVYELFRNPKS